MTPTSALVFAAGFGTRMRPLTADCPKPLLVLNGRTLLDHTLSHLAEAGVRNMAVNAHYLAHRIQRHLAGRDVSVLVETPEILDTGGGLKNARQVLGDRPVFTANPDVAWKGANPFGFLASETSEGPGATLLLIDPARATGRTGPGDFRLDTDGLLTRGGPLIYGGVQIIDPGCVDRIAEPVFSLNAVWDLLAKDGQLRGVVYPGHWCDVGSPAGLRAAETLLGGGP